ncbi:Transcription factor, K-box [Dillenia turbinata]|uniref:Transcription factor, K-box n=1 Tax=Dillenia turbinata TaxID=194707 RepID=A0AAN8W587_9MAGN
MARGKIQIRKIENATNRQVTYSKRRNGLFKKAGELTVLCDAKVSIIMFSGTGKMHEFISPSLTTKQVYDDYQKSMGMDLWKTHYERMQENLKKLKETNRNLRKEIRQRMGEQLNDLGIDELRALEENMENAVKVIRDRKWRNVQDIHRKLLQELDARAEDPHYGFVDNGGDGDYNSMIAYANGGPRHSGAGSDLTTFTLLE